jgi:hypothetical protein
VISFLISPNKVRVMSCMDQIWYFLVIFSTEIIAFDDMVHIILSMEGKSQYIKRKIFIFVLVFMDHHFYIALVVEKHFFIMI